MKIKFSKKATTQLAALFLVLIVCVQLFCPVLAAGIIDTVTISTVDDLIKFSQNCSMDTWSQGKTVVLQADISLKGVDFSPIPTFGGNFEGNGYTISGLNITGSYSPAGLFGILQEGSSVNCLNVTGNVAPSGEENAVGGIAGVNNGKISNCTFIGTIIGEEEIGGIAGRNAFTGTITDCTVSGGIVGENMTGGIVGQNAGSVMSCINESYVNTTSVDPSISLDELNASMTIDFYSIASFKMLNVSSDTGGIAGYSNGIILSCTNKGVVGYQHLGYNIAGIAGRSSGHIANNVNHGEIYGRKDVGGIVGQAEPYITITISQDLTQSLQDELKKLKRLVDDAVSAAGSSSAAVSAKLEAIGSCIRSIYDNAGKLAEQASDYGNQAVNKINRESEMIGNTLDRMAAITKQIRDIFNAVMEGMDRLEKSVLEFAKTAELSADAADELKLAVDDIRTAAGKVSEAQHTVNDGIVKLKSAVSIKDENAAKQALDEIYQGLNDLNQAYAEMQAALNKIADVIEGSSMNGQALISAVRELSTALSQAAAALQTIANGVNVFFLNVNFSLKGILNGVVQIQDGIAQLADAYENIDSALSHISNSLGGLDATSDQMAVALKSLSDTIDYFKGVSSSFTDLIDDIYKLFDYLKSVDPIQVSAPEEEIQSTAKSICSSVGEMEKQISLLNSEISSASDKLQAKVLAINNQVSVVSDAAMNILYQSQEEASNGRITDASEADIDAVTNGKIYACDNYGTVSADLNVGGIAGAISVEHEEDPEDDISSNFSTVYRKKFGLKAILQKCTNEGVIIAKRDCVGSIAGKIDLGLITKCEGYGRAESESGDYVGGIAGLSGGSIRRSYAKCVLSGKDYIGGVIGCGVVENLMGSGSVVSDCYTLIKIEQGEQYLGAIAGLDTGSFSDNYYVGSEELAAINRLSYAGKAEPIPYDKLLAVEGLPNEFRHFYLKFIADGEIIDSHIFEYGATFTGSIFPEIPKKEGYYEKWDCDDLSNLDFDTVVTAVYAQNITALESSEIRSDGRAIFFVEGQFCDADAVKAAAQAQTPDEFNITSDLTDIFSAMGNSMPINRKVVEQWNLTIPNDGLASHTVRYLAPDGETDNLSIYVKQDDGWTRLKIDVIGSYLTFVVEENTVEIAVLSKIPYWWIWLPILTICLLIIFLIILLVVKLRKSRKKGKTSAESYRPLQMNTENVSGGESDDLLNRALAAEEEIAKLRAELDIMKQNDFYLYVQEEDVQKNSSNSAVMTSDPTITEESSYYTELKPVKYRKKRRWMVPLIISLLAVGSIIAAVTYFLGSDLHTKMEAYHCVQEFIKRDESYSELSIAAEVGSQKLNSTVKINCAEVDKSKVVAVNQDGRVLYYSDGAVILENGKAYEIGASLPNYSVLLEETAGLYKSFDVSATEYGKGKTYTMIVEGSDAQRILKKLLPSAAAYISDMQSVKVELVEEGRKLSVIRFSSNGTLADAGRNSYSVNAEMAVKDKNVDLIIPQVVKDTVSKDEIDTVGELDSNLFRLIYACIELNKGKIAADLKLSADCGPLVLNDHFEFFRKMENNLEVNCLRKQGYSLYFTENVLCSEKGQKLVFEDEPLVESSELIECAYQICLNGNFDYTENKGVYTYMVSLDEDEMASVAYAIAPETKNLSTVWKSGGIRITVENDTVTHILFECKGLVKIVTIDMPASVSAELDLKDFEASRFTVPEAVKNSLTDGIVTNGK